MTWLMNNVSTVIVSLILCIVIITILRNMIKKGSACSSGSDCSSCGASCTEQGSTLVEKYHQDHV